MSYKVELFLSSDYAKDSLCFKAIVHDVDSYDIIIDIANSYERIFKSSIRGDYEYEYFDVQTMTTIEHKINGHTLDEKMAQYKKMYEDLYGYYVEVNEANFMTLFGVRLVGPSFRYDAPMMENFEYRADKHMHKLKTALFPSNNEIFKFKDTGSLKVQLQSTEIDDKATTLIRQIYEDINNKCISIENVTEELVRNYKDIIYELNKINMMSNLERFFITIDDHEFEIVERKYLSVIARNILHTQESVTGYIANYRVTTDSFELINDGKDAVHCHLLHLKNSTGPEYSELIKIVKKFSNEANTRLEVTGIMNKLTIDVITYSLLDE